MPVSKSCKIPIATWLSASAAGTGQPHIMCPIEKYMRTSRNITDALSRFRSCGVSVSASASSASVALVPVAAAAVAPAAAAATVPPAGFPAPFFREAL